MSEAPACDERISLPKVAHEIDDAKGEPIARDIIKSRAARGIITLWATKLEQIEPRDYDNMVSNAYAKAVEASKGDTVAAAIAMQGWYVPEDAEWTRDVWSDAQLPAKFWKNLSLYDNVWVSGDFLGRLESFPGYEQNWTGIFMSVLDAVACGLPRGFDSTKTSVDYKSVEAFLADLYATAKKKIDWSRDAWPAASERFGPSLKRHTVKEILDRRGLISGPGRPRASA